MPGIGLLAPLALPNKCARLLGPDRVLEQCPTRRALHVKPKQAQHPMNANPAKIAPKMTESEGDPVPAHSDLVRMHASTGVGGGVHELPNAQPEPSTWHVSWHQWHVYCALHSTHEVKLQ